MRLVEVGGGWILLRPLTVRGYWALKNGDILQCLYIQIADWSEEAPVTIETIRHLKDSIVDALTRELLQSVEPVMSMDKDLLRRYVGMFLKGVRAPHDEMYRMLTERYFWLAQMMIDHKGNIKNLPEQGGWLDQPLDWVIVLEIYRTEFVKLLVSQKGVKT